MNNRVALLYDFDYTLASGYMQSFGMMQDFGFDDIMEFFKYNDAVVNESDMDMCLSLMYGILEKTLSQNKAPTKEFFRKFGENVEYYPGVIDWFDKINNIGKENGIEVEHYIISSGLREIIEGTKIANKFKRIYASFFAYNKDGHAFWPAQVVNYTSKTQYIYRVRKNALDNLRDLQEINEKRKTDDVLPFSNIIYFGDSETDIPSFTVVKSNGGLSICVYDPRYEKSRNIAQKAFIEDRVNYFTPADYTENGDLFVLIKNYIEKLAKNK